VVWPYLHDLQKEGGEQGRRRITQYTRYGAVFLCLIQSYGIATGLEHYSNPAVVLVPGMVFRLLTTITLTAGTIFLMWLGEQISERGVGNGISLIIYAGIAARIPQGLGTTMNLYRSGELSFLKIILMLAVIVGTFLYYFYREGSAEDSGSVRQKNCRAEGIRGSEYPYSLEDQYFGGDSSYFCFFFDHVSCYGCDFFSFGAFSKVYRDLAARWVTLQRSFCGFDCFFLFFLYSSDF